jgi:hypothetical protein
MALTSECSESFFGSHGDTDPVILYESESYFFLQWISRLRRKNINFFYYFAYFLLYKQKREKNEIYGLISWREG